MPVVIHNKLYNKALLEDAPGQTILHNKHINKQLHTATNTLQKRVLYYYNEKRLTGRNITCWGVVTDWTNP